MGTPEWPLCRAPTGDQPPMGTQQELRIYNIQTHNTAGDGAIQPGAPFIRR